MVTITINPCEIIVPTAFTPGQEPNMNWEIVNLDEVYPNNIVMIYNRWGNLIYEHASDPSNPYSLNPWDGTNQANGEPLPVASYYYVIQFNNGTDEGLKGTVTIIK
jgi:gliding motility-associated-like protein